MNDRSWVGLVGSITVRRGECPKAQWEGKWKKEQRQGKKDEQPKRIMHEERAGGSGCLSLCVSVCLVYHCPFPYVLLCIRKVSEEHTVRLVERVGQSFMSTYQKEGITVDRGRRKRKGRERGVEEEETLP